MESMPQQPNHGSATVGSPYTGSGAMVQFNPTATDFPSQVPPYPSAQQPIRSTSGPPPFTGQHSGYQYTGQTKDQHAGYQYTGQGFGDPIPGPVPMAAPPPAVAGQAHQWPPTFSRPPGGAPPSSFSPPNAGPPFAPPMAGSLLSQPPSFPAMGSKALVSGSFPMPGQMISPGDQTAISGPSPTLGYLSSTGNVATSQRTAPIIQTTGSGSFQTPGPTATHINPAAISESFQNLVNPMSVGEQRGPPSFGSVQASTSASYPVAALSNLVPAPLGFLGDRELSSQLPPYRPEVLGQAPRQFRASSQPGLHPPQYPQYGGQPHMTSTYADGGSPYPVAAPPFSGNVQGLVEEFQSLSMATVSGSMEARVDPSTLPRPSTATEYPAWWSTTNCNLRYLRLTCGSLPNSHSLVARWHLPLGAVVHPLAEAPSNEEVPVVDFGTSGIARCRRCRTYINPYAVFTDNGRRWRCNLCGMSNEVPSEYYCPLDENGRRRDADERPELSKGSVEFIAPAEYMVRPPMPPVYFFLIDVSSSAIKTGMLQIAVDTIKSCLDKLPGYPRTQIGFLTFDSTLHFYCLKSSLTHPQMMVVADLDDPFLPMPDDLLVNLSESRTVVEVLLDSLPSMFENNLNVESAAGPALRAVYMIMSQLGGKLLFFQSTLPSLGVGRLKLRGDDPRIYGTDREPSLRNSEDSFYKQMAADFSKFQIGVNLYAFPESHIDLVSLGTLAKYTGGQVYYYPSFQPYLHREKFSYELARDLTRETAWEAVMRIRCGKGVRFNTFHGHFMLRSSDLMALPAVDCDKAFAMQLTLEDTLLTSQMVYFQVALLFTSSTGERRIRIHTLAAPVVSELSEMYRSADTGSIMMLMSRLALEKSLVLKLEEVRQQSIQVKLVRALREYRNMYAVQHRLAGRLIYPDSLKLLPLYCLALYKCLALRGGYADATLDERAAAGFDMMVMSVPRLLKLLYPSLVRLDDHLLKGEADIELIQPLPLTAERLDPCGAFLVNDGLRFIVWLGKVLPADFVAHLLGMEAVSSADLMKVAVSEQDNDLSKRFMMLLKSLRESNRAIYQQCLLIRQGDQPREGFLVLFNLVEDRITGSMGYADWMMQIYQQVLQKR